MFCCKKKAHPKERPRLEVLSAVNRGYVTDGTETIGATSLSPGHDVELPTKKPGPANALDVRVKVINPYINPELPPRKPVPGPKPKLPERNPNAKIIPHVERKNEPPTGIVQPPRREEFSKPATSQPAIPLEGKDDKDSFAEIREAIALRDYTAAEIDMLSFSKGDLLEVVVISEKTWWDGRKKSSDERGMVNRGHISLKPSSIKKKSTGSAKEEVIIVRNSITSSSSTGPERPWFKGTISKKQAEYLLLFDDSFKGNFLVREDENPLVFILGVRKDEGEKECNNYEIKTTNDKQFFIYPEKKFSSLDELVKYYTENKGRLISEPTKPSGTAENQDQNGTAENQDQNGTAENQDQNENDEKTTVSAKNVSDTDGESDPDEKQDRESAEDSRDYQTTLGRRNSTHVYGTGTLPIDASLNTDVYDEGISAVETEATEPKKSDESKVKEEDQELYEELACSDCKTVEVLYDYEARLDDELSLKTGETLHVENYEGLWWHAHRPGSMEEGLIPSNFVAKPDSLNIYPWYFGVLDNSSMEKCLQNEENKEGTFLVRKSLTMEGRHTISVLSSDESGKSLIKNIRICHDNDQVYIYKGKTFSNIPDLIGYYIGMETSIPLLSACPRRAIRKRTNESSSIESS